MKTPEKKRQFSVYLTDEQKLAVIDVAEEMHARLGPTIRHLLLIGLKAERARLGLPPAGEMTPQQRRTAPSYRDEVLSNNPVAYYPDVEGPSVVPQRPSPARYEPDDEDLRPDRHSPPPVGQDPFGGSL